MSKKFDEGLTTKIISTIQTNSSPVGDRIGTFPIQTNSEDGGVDSEDKISVGDENNMRGEI